MNYTTITLLIFVCICISINERKFKESVRNALYWFFALIFSLIFAYRDIYRTRDTLSYIEVFNAVSIQDGYFEIYNRFEGGFCFLNRIIKLLSENQIFYLFSISFLIFGLYFVVLKLIDDKTINTYSKGNALRIYPITFLSIYIGYFGLLYNSIAIRAGVMLPMFYISYILMLKRKIISSLIIIIISSTIHSSAFFFIPLLIVAYKKLTFDKKNALIIWCVSFIAYLLGLRLYIVSLITWLISYLSNIFPSFLFISWSSHYIEGEKADNEVAYFKIFVYFVILFLIKHERSNRLSHFTTLSIIGLILISILGCLPIINRITDILLLSLCFSLYNQICFKRNKTISAKVFMQLSLIISVFYLAFLLYCT